MKAILPLIIFLLLINLNQLVLAAERDQALIGVSGHYHQTFTDRDQAVSHIANFIQQPTKEKSKLPPMAINTWGLMPPLALPLASEEVQAVSYWVWEIYNIECTQSTKLFFCQHFQQK